MSMKIQKKLVIRFFLTNFCEFQSMEIRYQVEISIHLSLSLNASLSKSFQNTRGTRPK